jgi:uncharacterized membrane protein YcaP (DUF421 family)
VHSVFRAIAIYGFLLVMFRATGKRSLGHITTFDFVLLLIIGNATQNAMLDYDYSVTNSYLVVLTLIVLDTGLMKLKQKFRKLERWIEDTPVLILENGRPLRELMEKANVDEQDIMEAARSTQGLERMDQIKYAILERNGSISVIPNQ